MKKLLCLATLLVALPALVSADLRTKTKEYRFNNFDVNGDKKVDYQEYSKERSNRGRPEEETTFYFQHYDTDDNGFISLDEYLHPKPSNIDNYNFSE